MGTDVADRDRKPGRRWWARGLVGSTLVLLVVLLWGTGCMERLFFYPERGATPLPPGHPGVESVHFVSADGTRLHGWFLPARGPEIDGPELPPTIIHAHGNAGNISGHLSFTDYLPEAGFNLFVFDYRGYGESEGSARRRADLIADTEAAIDAMLARDDVDGSRIGVYGQSLGGSIALVAIRDRPEVRAAVIDSAFASWREMAAAALSRGDPGFIASSIAGLLIRDSHRPDEAAAAVDRPLLVVHGSNDSIVPVSHGRRIAEAAPEARLVILEGGEHNSLRFTHPEIEAIVVEFLRTNLP